MDIIIGSGKNRQKFVIPTGHQLKQIAKTNPIEHVKIVGNVKALVRAHTKAREGQP